MNEKHNVTPGTPASTNPADLSPAPEPSGKGVKRWTLLIIGALILVSAVWFIVSMMSKTTAPGKGEQSPAAQKLFEDMLSAAASKSRVQLTYAEKSFKSKADFEAQLVQDQRYSVAELDAATKDYRAVYAIQQQSGADLVYYTVRRCLEGKMFKPNLSFAYKTLDAARDVLKQPLTVTAEGSEANDCSLSDPDHPGRITDGVIPVGLNQNQIKGWFNYLHEANFVQVEDKGITTYNQKPVRKLHFVTNSLAGAGNFSSAVQQGAGLQLTDNGAPGPDSYRLDHIETSDNIDGFYLIDEQTKLPVYSEFVTISLLLKDNAQASANNPSKPRLGKVFKQLYAYPESLTLSQTSTINILE